MNRGVRIVVGLREIACAAAMPRAQGFTRPAPRLFCAAFIATSMYLPPFENRITSADTASAVWISIGTLSTAICGMAHRACLGLIPSGIVGPKLPTPRGDAA